MVGCLWMPQVAGSRIVYLILVREESLAQRFWGICVCLVACSCLTMIFGISVLDDTSGGWCLVA